MSAEMARLVRAKREQGTQREKLLMVAKLAREVADFCFTQGDEIGGKSLLEIADYARRKAEEKEQWDANNLF